MIFFELLHLKMDVTVSETGDVIRGIEITAHSFERIGEVGYIYAHTSR